MTTDSRVGTRFDAGKVYFIDHERKHGEYVLTTFLAGRRVVMFGGPAPFSRLDTEQARDYAMLCSSITEAGVDMVYGIYVQDAFVCRAFEDKIDAEVGDNLLVLLGDGISSFVKEQNLEYDFTDYGLGKRMVRWAAVINDGVVEYFVEDPFQEINLTSAKNLLAYLNETKVSKPV
jgi:peroxiredoxin